MTNAFLPGKVNFCSFTALRVSKLFRPTSSMLHSPISCLLTDSSPQPRLDNLLCHCSTHIFVHRVSNTPLWTSWFPFRIALLICTSGSRTLFCSPVHLRFPWNCITIASSWYNIKYLLLRNEFLLQIVFPILMVWLYILPQQCSHSFETNEEKDVQVSSEKDRQKSSGFLMTLLGLLILYPSSCPSSGLPVSISGGFATEDKPQATEKSQTASMTWEQHFSFKELPFTLKINFTIF